MNYFNNMMSGWGDGCGGYGIMVFAWLPYLLTVALLILGIIALWKYINKK